MVRSKLITHTTRSSAISYEHVAPEELVPARAQQQRALAKYLASAQSAVERDYREGLARQALPEGDK